jgi:hypothetical protein
MTNKEDFRTAEDDIYDECRKYGRVRKIIIPRPSHIDSKNRQLPLHVQLAKFNKYVILEGAGKAYVRFERSD